MFEFVGICSKCLRRIERNPNNCGTGYAIANFGPAHGEVKVCYACCADLEKDHMRTNGKIALYIDEKRKTVTNWPGTLQFKWHSISKGKHNWGLERIDVWFTFEGYEWHGVHIGYNNEIVHCKRTKRQVT